MKVKVFDLGNWKTLKVKHGGEIDLEWYKTVLFVTTGHKDSNGMVYLTKKQALKLATILKLWATKGLKSRKPGVHMARWPTKKNP